MSGPRTRRLLAALLLLTAPGSVLAWNAAGHRLVAAIAWERLETREQAAIGALLARHPDHERWQKRRSPGDAPARTAFLEASTWPDDIRNDPRFREDADAAAAAAGSGFASLARRRHWHYVDQPVDARTPHRSGNGELDRQLGRLPGRLGDPAAPPAERVEALVWLIHLVADAHQPLHAASRDDDGGGNGLTVRDPGHPRRAEHTLHGWWDDLPGPPWLRGRRLDQAAVALAFVHAPASDDGGSPADWLAESWQLARTMAYALPAGDPPVLDARYRAAARDTAERQLVRAGLRLARLLRATLAP